MVRRPSSAEQIRTSPGPARSIRWPAWRVFPHPKAEYSAILRGSLIPAPSPSYPGLQHEGQFHGDSDRPDYSQPDQEGHQAYEIRSGFFQHDPDIIHLPSHIESTGQAIGSDYPA